MLYGDPYDNSITDEIIRCAIEVHRELGPGLLESIYESALCMELQAAQLSIQRQVGVPLYYKGVLLCEHRPDLIVAGHVVVEVKSVERFDQIHVAQVMTYLRVTQLRVGLLLNFNTAFMKQGIRRVML